MQYTDKVIEHFTNPRNIGEITDADGIGVIGSQDCGDTVKVWIKVADAHLVDIKYKVFGCPAAIAVCSMMTELAIGMHVDDAYEITDAQVAEALGGLPDQKYHCSNLAASALHKAILNFVLKKPELSNTITITTLVNNSAPDNLQSEHGLSFWIECADKRILFDTGQSDIFIQNATALGIDLAEADVIILSHGHYDHIGGLAAVLDIAVKAKVYLHPAAIEQKFSRKASGPKLIGMSESTKEVVQTLESKGSLAWTEQPVEIIPGIFVTGPIPRKNNFEDTGGDFFVDKDCLKADELPDDQAIYFKTGKGIVILLGCAHSGVVNTLDYIVRLTGVKRIYAVIGGMHLLNASVERIERTIGVLRQYDVQKIGLAHCTGNKAVKKFESTFPGQCFECSVGTQIEL